MANLMRITINTTQAVGIVSARYNVQTHSERNKPAGAFDVLLGICM